VVTAASRVAAWARLAAVRAHLAMVTRWRWDAALDAPAPARRSQQTGRPRKTGRRWPPLHQGSVAAVPQWQGGTVDGG
jgi:hypothetical protein